MLLLVGLVGHYLISIIATVVVGDGSFEQSILSGGNANRGWPGYAILVAVAIVIGTHTPGTILRRNLRWAALFVLVTSLMASLELAQRIPIGADYIEQVRSAFLGGLGRAAVTALFALFALRSESVGRSPMIPLAGLGMAVAFAYSDALGRGLGSWERFGLVLVRGTSQAPLIAGSGLAIIFRHQYPIANLVMRKLIVVCASMSGLGLCLLMASGNFRVAGDAVLLASDWTIYIVLFALLVATQIETTSPTMPSGRPSITLAIVITTLFFAPAGIVACLLAARSRVALEAGNLDQAASDRDRATSWEMISLAVGAFLIIPVFLLVV